MAIFVVFVVGVVGVDVRDRAGPLTTVFFEALLSFLSFVFVVA